jgi:hypothetical protein
VSRKISIAVLFAVIAPTFLIFADLKTSAETKLPACCRRDGKHHCAMTVAVGDASSETQFKAATPVCPFQSQASTVPLVASYLPAATSVHFGGLQSHPAIHAQTFATLRISETRSHQKRGPPPLLNS